jgi:hypothetical protein
MRNLIQQSASDQPYLQLSFQGLEGLNMLGVFSLTSLPARNINIADFSLLVYVDHALMGRWLEPVGFCYKVRQITQWTTSKKWQNSRRVSAYITCAL